MSQQPLLVFTDREKHFDAWMEPLIYAATRPIAIVPLRLQSGGSVAPFLIPYLSDFGGLSLFISQDVVIDHDVYDFVEQAKQDKFRAIYLLHGKQDVMLFRNKYCTTLTPEYLSATSREALSIMTWAGAKENVGLLTLKPVVV